MSMQDPIADMLTRIRNAIKAEHASVTVPHSRIKEGIANVLEAEGFIDGVEVIDVGSNRSEIQITLRYTNGVSAIRELRRESKASVRSYSNASNIPREKGGLGIVILSTNKGLLVDRVARHDKVGGELLCSVF